MRIYITGVISKGGTLSLSEINNNLHKFRLAAELLRSQGHDPTDPTWHDPEGEDERSTTLAGWVEYLRKDIKLLMDCDAIYLLKGWEESRGSRLEVYIARELGLEEIYE